MSLHAFQQFSPVMQLYWVIHHGTFLANRWDEDSGVNLYPSAGATVARVALRGLDGEKFSVRVVDMLGRTVAVRQLIPLGYQADALLTLPDDLPAGMYLLTLCEQRLRPA